MQCVTECMCNIISYISYSWTFYLLTKPFVFAGPLLLLACWSCIVSTCISVMELRSQVEVSANCLLFLVLTHKSLSLILYYPRIIIIQLFMKIMITTSLIAPLYMYNIMVKGHYDINETIITSPVASLYMSLCM